MTLAHFCLNCIGSYYSALYCIRKFNRQTVFIFLLKVAILLEGKQGINFAMVFISLQISCQFENIEEIKTDSSYSYFLKLRCNNCGESDDIWHDICEEERTQHDTRNAKGYNMIIKCKMCSRENTIDIVEDSKKSYAEDDTGKLKSIVTFDCRGIEPIDFDPREGFIVKSSDNGTTFENAEIENGDWCDFDEKNGKSVAISEFKSNFVKVKGTKK
ncbi:hypothetical protein ACKWTF_006438 [Chironomus riparius]